MVGLAVEAAFGDESGTSGDEVADAVDLPRGVEQTNRAGARIGCVGTDLQQGEVVVVGRARRPQERDGVVAEAFSHLKVAMHM